MDFSLYNSLSEVDVEEQSQDLCLLAIQITEEFNLFQSTVVLTANILWIKTHPF